MRTKAATHFDVPEPTTLKARVLPKDAALSSSAVKVGLCSSGGGNRAFVYTMGVFRALSQLGVLPAVELFSTVSGSSWLTGLYMFANGTDEELLGNRTVPEALSMEGLQEQPSLFGQRAVGALGSWDDLSLELPSSWEHFVATSYLKPFGLDEEAYLAQSEKAVERIRKENPSLKGAPFMVPRSDRQQQKWITAVSLLSPVGFEPSASNVAQLEVSPEYVGVPAELGVSYETALGGSLPPLPRRLGGGFVETFAFGGDAPAQVPTAPGPIATMQVGAPEQPFSLAKALGISSFYLGGELAGLGLVGSLETPRAKYWPVPGQGFSSSPEAALEYVIADGGSADNSGIMPQLARSARRIFWVSSSFQPLNMSYDWQGACARTTTFDPVAAGVIGSVMDKFGFGKLVAASRQGFFYANNQVFEQTRFLDVCCAMWRQVASGQPALVLFKEPVMPNQWHGIAGGYEVEVALLQLDNTQSFTSRLPLDTQQELEKGAFGALANFPIFKTSSQNSGELIAYSNEQVNLLAAQAEFSVLHHRDAIVKFFMGH